MEKLKNKRNIKIGIFVLYLLISGIFVIMHEPWRDEIHAWLMSKNYNILELIEASRFDGHPILWHLILMPFAKLGFNVIFLNIINYIIVSLSAGIFFFKEDKLPDIFKIFTLFTIPFMYVYSSFARNYSLILFILVLISYIYKDRYSKPLLYSILICFLIHTHALAWGIVAGLTITFHIREIVKYIKTKIKPQKYLKIMIGLILIIINTVIVIIQLYGSENGNFQVYYSQENIFELVKMSIILISTFIICLVNKKMHKEYVILLLGYVFMLIVYSTFYSSIIIQRNMLIYMYLLFYIDILLSNENKEKNSYEKMKKYIIAIYIIIFFAIDFITLEIYSIMDLKMNYSSAKEMAEYINENIESNTEILTPCSVFTQTIIPYCKENIYQFDIVYNERVDCANVEFNFEKSLESLRDLSIYPNKYILVNDLCNYCITENCELIYSTKKSLSSEQFYLYYIKK